MKLYQRIASTIQARINCLKNDNFEWIEKYSKYLNELADELPSGSGFDDGTAIDWSESTGNKLVFYTSYHHMVDGFYTEWTDHRIIIKPDFINEIDISVSGKNKNDIKSHIYDVFYECLT